MNIKLQISRQSLPIAPPPLSDKERRAKAKLHSPSPSIPKRPRSKVNQTVDKKDSMTVQQQFGNEFKQWISKQEIVSPVVVTQTQILKKVTDILSENQKILAKQQTRIPLSPAPQNPHSSLSDLNRLIHPMQLQIQEIKRMLHENNSNTKRVDKGSSGQMQKLLQAKARNKGIMQNTNQMSKQLQKNVAENIGLLGQYQQNNLKTYSELVLRLKEQIQQLQRQSQKAQRNLYQKINKIQKITLQPKFAEQRTEPYQQMIITRLATLNLSEIRTNVLQKLGGQFDYFGLQTDLNSIKRELQSVYNEFKEDSKAFDISVPTLQFTQDQLAVLNLPSSSVLQSFKAKYQHLRQKPAAVPAPAVRQIQKRVPSNLSQIKTVPKDVSKQVKLQKANQVRPQTILQSENSHLRTRQPQYSQEEAGPRMNLLKRKSKRAQNQSSLLDIYLQHQMKMEMRQLTDKMNQQLQQAKLKALKNIQDTIALSDIQMKLLAQKKQQLDMINQKSVEEAAPLKKPQNPAPAIPAPEPQEQVRKKSQPKRIFIQPEQKQLQPSLNVTLSQQKQYLLRKKLLDLKKQERKSQERQQPPQPPRMPFLPSQSFSKIQLKQVVLRRPQKPMPKAPPAQKPLRFVQQQSQEEFDEEQQHRNLLQRLARLNHSSRSQNES